MEVSSVGRISMLLSGWLGETLSVSSISWAWLGDSGCGELAVSVLGVGDLPSDRPSNSWTLWGRSWEEEKRVGFMMEVSLSGSD